MSKYYMEQFNRLWEDKEKLKDVTDEVITYDELLSKMEILYKVLGGKDD